MREQATTLDEARAGRQVEAAMTALRAGRRCAACGAGRELRLVMTRRGGRGLATSRVLCASCAPAAPARPAGTDANVARRRRLEAAEREVGR